MMFFKLNLPGLPFRLLDESNETQVPFRLGVGDFVIGDDRHGLRIHEK